MEGVRGSPFVSEPSLLLGLGSAKTPWLYGFWLGIWSGDLECMKKTGERRAEKRSNGMEHIDIDPEEVSQTKCKQGEANKRRTPPQLACIPTFLIHLLARRLRSTQVLSPLLFVFRLFIIGLGS